MDKVTNEYFSIIHKGGVYTNCFPNREYSVWLNNTNNPIFQQASAGDGNCQIFTENSANITPGKWLHFVGVINRNNHFQKVYINGELNLKIADSYNSFNNNNEDLRIGFPEETIWNNFPFKGALDDIRFYNRALNDTEIQRLYRTSQQVNL
ncbi:hypothetical protein JCM14076_24930 [Methylosoma difficile]